MKKIIKRIGSIVVITIASGLAGAGLGKVICDVSYPREIEQEVSFSSPEEYKLITGKTAPKESNLRFKYTLRRNNEGVYDSGYGLFCPELSASIGYDIAKDIYPEIGGICGGAAGFLAYNSISLFKFLRRKKDQALK